MVVALPFISPDGKRMAFGTHEAEAYVVNIDGSELQKIAAPYLLAPNWSPDRGKLVQSQAAERNRLLKPLESASIKLASVARDVFGVSGRLMLGALIEGKASPKEMAELAKKQLRKKRPEREVALEGRVEEHHRFLLKLQLDRPVPNLIECCINFEHKCRFSARFA